MQVSVVGIVSFDEIHGQSVRRVVGGAGHNVAIGCAVTGLRPQVVSVVGPDLQAGTWKILRGRCDCSRLAVERGNTCRFQVVEQAGERTFHTEPGVALGLTAHARRWRYAGCWVHVCCTWPTDGAAVLETVVGTGGSASVGFIRRSAAQQLEGVRAYWERLRYVFVNEEEYEVLKVQGDSRRGDVTVIVTLGERGALAVRRGAVVHRERAVRVMNARDTTGAGDVFAGAFIGVVAQGGGVPAAMRGAARVAARSVRGFGVGHLVARTE